jgi:hypothetical protein
VRLFVLACGVPETELDGWRKAWKLAMAPDRPAWQEEQQHLLAKIDQLTTDLAAAEARTGQLTTQLAAAKERIDQLTVAVEAAKARAEGAEAALAAYHQSQSAALCLPEPLERLRIKADIHRKTGDYAAAIDLYRRIARHVKREHGPGDPRTLQAQHEHLEVKAEALESRCGVRFRVFARHTLDARWRKLICAHQRWLPERSRTTLELRLDHIYWVAILLRRRRGKTTSSPSLGPSPPTGSTTSSSLPYRYPYYADGPSPAHKLLIGLYADCKIFLPPDDRFTEEVFRYMHTEDLEFKRPQRHRWDTSLRPRQQACDLRPQQQVFDGVFRYGPQMDNYPI